jgi:uncharacterized protein (DUF1501 family)
MTCTRRQFLTTSSLAAAVPLLTPRLVFAGGAKAATGQTLVVVFQRGGLDALNAIPPHGDADYYRLRPTLAVPRPGTGANAAIDLDGFFGLNPMLAPLEPLYRSGSLAVVHATGFVLGSRSHFDCQDFMERAALNSANVSSGWLNRHLEASGVTETFQGIGVGRALQLSLQGGAPVIGLGTIAGFTVRTTSTRKDAIQGLFETLYDADNLLAANSRRALGAVDDLAAANPAQYPVEGGATYPTTTFGSQMREVAQLIKADVGLDVACVDIGGWDHHDDEAALLGPLLDELAKTLAAFHADLGARMANVTVVTMTEFGRRAQENASRGTDHGSGYAMLLMGGGVVGNTVYRQWPGLSDAALFRGDLAITIDYRTVLSELLDKRLGGTDLGYVFPGFTPQPYVGAFLPA